jgi:DNA (cytosine-5)-methyltransferase 1
MLSVLDLFCGAGGLGIGLEQAGFQVATAVDDWQAAVDTCSAFHPGARVLKSDIYEFNQRLLEDGDLRKEGFDVVVGGPPCQGFCGMNRHRSPGDRRNSLIEAFVQTVEIVQPRIVCMENVTGLLSLGDGKYLTQLLAAFEQLGYSADFRVIQAGYYGVPQNRWRFILLAAKGVRAFHWPEPVHAFHRTAAHNVRGHKAKILLPITAERGLFTDPLPAVTVGDAISDLPAIENGGAYEGPYVDEPLTWYQAVMRQDAKSLTCHATLNSREKHVERYRHIPKNKANSGWLDLPDELKPGNLKNFSDCSYDNRFGRLNWDGTFNTVMAKVEPYWSRVIHPEQDRLISVRESARAQGFPDGLVFQGCLSEQYRLVGNAVPPPLGRALGAAMLDSLGIANEVFEEYRAMISSPNPRRGARGTALIA